MVRRMRIAAVIAALWILAAGCGAPTAGSATPHPDTAALAGLWEQLIPMDGMPESITLEASGAAMSGGEAARWRLEGNDLYLKRGGQETRYGYTLAGYMLTLFDYASDTSEFYINPESFAAGADGNAELKGRWAAWSAFSKLDFDGEGGLTTAVYTTAGRTDLSSRYAARDGILQTVDTSGNYTYNLYSFASDGTLLLAETSEYDSDTRQNTAYWKTAEPPAGLLGEWQEAVSTEPAGAGLPELMKLSAGGKGSAGQQGGDAQFMKWEYYAGGFLLFEHSETDLQYAWCTLQDGVLFLGNPDVEEAWYLGSGYKPGSEPLKALEGTWKRGDSKLALTIKSGGVLEITNSAGKTAMVSVSAAGGVLELTKDGRTYHMAYTADDTTMELYYGEQPFLEENDMPVTLDKY